jgi:uncharacterized protein YqfA (UPF0365 family)
MKIIIAILIGLIILYYVPLGFYFKAKVSGIKVSLIELFKFRLRKIPTYLIFNWNKRLNDNNIKVDFKDLVKCYLDGNELENVVSGLIEAKNNQLKLSFEKACIADTQKIDIKRTVINTITHVGKEK